MSQQDGCLERNTRQQSLLKFNAKEGGIYSGHVFGHVFTFPLYLRLASELVLFSSCILLVSVMSPGKY